MLRKLKSSISRPERDFSEDADDSTYITRINYKYIPHPHMLKLALEEKLGKKQFEFEMRQSTYIIKSRCQLSMPDIVEAVKRQEYPTQTQNPGRWYKFGRSTS